MLAFQAKEEVEALEKKMVQLENELTTTTTNLENSNKRLEEREKALQNVSHLQDGVTSCVLTHNRTNIWIFITTLLVSKQKL